MKYKNKKAMEMPTFLTTIISLLVVLFVLLIFYGQTREKSNEQNIPQMCRKNIELNAIGHVSGAELYDEVSCPAEYYTLETTDADKIKKELGNAMVSCWYKMGEGKYEVFDTNLGDEQYCVICSVTEFDSAPQEISGFAAYLSKNPAPLFYTQKSGETYFNYMQGFASDTSLDLLFQEETRDLVDTQYDYATIFFYTKRGYMDKIMSTGAGAAVGLISGGILIATGVGAPAGIILAGSTLVGAGTGAYLGAETTADWESAVGIYPYTVDTLQQLNCHMLPVEQKTMS